MAASALNAALPTYQTAAEFLEKKNGSGMRLAGWTLVRSLLIAPPLLVVGIPPKKAIAGSLLASGMISIFTMIRIYNAGQKAAPETAATAASE